MKKLLILDLMNLAMRAYFGHPGLTTQAGTPTGALFGVAQGINRLLVDYKPDYMIAAMDPKGKTFRHDLLETYKGNRKDKPAEFLIQMPTLRRLINAYGVPIIETIGYEADDVVGSLAARFASPELHVYVVSGDKDFAQLVNANVSLIRVTNSGYVDCDAKGVEEKFGIKPEQMIDYLALMGDAADCVPGVKGVGEVTAGKLLKSYGTLESVYSNLGMLKPALGEKLSKSQDLAFLSKKLVSIVTDLAVTVDMESAVPSDSKPELREIFNELEFFSMTWEPM